MTRRVDPIFHELLTAAVLFFLPSHKAGRLSEAQARERLLAAIDIERDAVAHWPAAAIDLLKHAEASLAGEPGGIDKDAIGAACDAVWPRYAPQQHFAWQNRADAGDGDSRQAYVAGDCDTEDRL